MLHIPEAVLITGGFGALQSAELFLPWNGSTCSLPSLPGERRWHTQTVGTLCGGYDLSGNSRRSCLKWEGGDWVTLPLRLSQERFGSSVWAREGGQFNIMGGCCYDYARETSDYVKGNITRPSFKMKYKTS